MAEVIDLLSSSPPSRREMSPPRNIRGKSSSKDIFTFHSDDFDSTGNLEFETEQPPKRQRLSPSPAPPRQDFSSRSFGDDIFNLPSEGDLLPELNVIAGISTTEKDNRNEFDIEPNDIFRFSSSAPEPRSKTPAKAPFVLELSSDAEPVPDDPIQDSSQPQIPSRPVFSETTANLLAGLRTTEPKICAKSKSKLRTARSRSVDVTLNTMAKFKQITKTSTGKMDDIIDSSQPEKVGKNSVAPSTEDKRTKAALKSVSKAAREAEREAEKQRKQHEKEQKAREKQKAADIAEVNKSKTNKKNSTPEMILDMPVGLQRLSLGNQVEEYMKQLDVEVTFSNNGEITSADDTDILVGNIIKWRRKVVADFDDDMEIWKPLPQPRITSEDHVLVYMKADEFVHMAIVGKDNSVKNASDVPVSTMKANLDAHVQLIRTHHPDSTIIYLIEGLTAWNRKSQTVKNRAYTAAVRSQALEDDPSTSTAPPPSQPRRGKRKSANPAIDLSSITTDLTEDLLLHFQLHHQPLLIHHTTSVATTASQISVFTQHLSTRPYRLAEQSHNLASASFCMTVGQIRTGTTPHETYINMLQEINRVTPSMAYGISNAGYKNVGLLVRGFKEQGNLMLEDVRKSVNKDGGWSDRRLGPMVSKRLFKVFMGRDPGARDGMA